MNFTQRDINNSTSAHQISRYTCPYCTISLLDQNQQFIHELRCPFKIYFLNQHAVYQQVLSNNTLLSQYEIRPDYYESSITAAIDRLASPHYYYRSQLLHNNNNDNQECINYASQSTMGTFVANGRDTESVLAFLQNKPTVGNNLGSRQAATGLQQHPLLELISREQAIGNEKKESATIVTRNGSFPDPRHRFTNVQQQNTMLDFTGGRVSSVELGERKCPLSDNTDCSLPSKKDKEETFNEEDITGDNQRLSKRQKKHAVSSSVQTLVSEQRHQDGEVENNRNTTLDNPIKLSLSSDEEALTPLQCFIRSECIVLFTACDSDVVSSSRGKRRPVDIGQVGICCSFCHSQRHVHNLCNGGGTYYPWKIEALYSASMNLIQRHFFICPNIPSHIRETYCSLKQLDARSGSSKAFWCKAAHQLGLADTPDGIRLTSGNNSDSTDAPNQTRTSYPHPSSQPVNAPEYLCFPEDQNLTTQFTFLLIRQMTSCKFTEGDRLGKRKQLPLGFPGIACRHCISDFGSGRFFPSTLKTISDTSKTLNVLHRHVLKCRNCPSNIKEELNTLRMSHDTERATMVFGCQKAFFFKIWKRIHTDQQLCNGIDDEQHK